MPPPPPPPRGRDIVAERVGFAELEAQALKGEDPWVKGLPRYVLGCAVQGPWSSPPHTVTAPPAPSNQLPAALPTPVGGGPSTSRLAPLVDPSCCYPGVMLQWLPGALRDLAVTLRAVTGFS